MLKACSIDAATAQQLVTIIKPALAGIAESAATEHAQTRQLIVDPLKRSISEATWAVFRLAKSVGVVSSLLDVEEFVSACIECNTKGLLNSSATGDSRVLMYMFFSIPAAKRLSTAVLLALLDGSVLEHSES